MLFILHLFAALLFAFSVWGLQLDTEELGLVKNEIADTMIKERMQRHSEIHVTLTFMFERNAQKEVHSLTAFPDR